MKLVKAILEAAQAALKRERGVRPAIYRARHPKYAFSYYPEYSETGVRPFRDPNCWRHGVGTFGEMVIPYEWIKEEDWEAVE